MNTMVALPILSAMPTAAPAFPGDDPIFAVIEAHRLSFAAMTTVLDECERVSERADEVVGPYHIEVPSMVEANTVVKASCWSDIEQAVPQADFPKEYEFFKKLLKQRQFDRRAFREMTFGDEDEILQPFFDAELKALREFQETQPTTLTGLLAMVAYAGEIREANADAFDSDRVSPLFNTMAKAARSVSDCHLAA